MFGLQVFNQLPNYLCKKSKFQILNRLFTSLKLKSSEQRVSSSPFLKYFATSGSDLSCSTKSASSRPACLVSHVFIALRWPGSSRRMRPKVSSAEPSGGRNCSPDQNA